jgi:hypothetical protein
MRGLILALALGLASGAMAGAAAETVRPDPDSALAGRQIFQTGSSPGGTAITALVGRASVRLPGARLPCAGCHGADRRGGAEGGVNAPDITPTALTRPFRAAGTNRERPAYDAAALVRAVTAGIDAGGNPLDPAMPRFEMAATDAASLAAYLLTGAAEMVPGVTADTISLGLLLPDTAQPSAGPAAFQAVLNVAIGEMNRTGGFYGRRIELAAGADLAAENVFAVLSMLPPGHDGAAQHLAAQGVPVFGLTPPPGPSAAGTGPQVFYLMAGLEQEIRGLIRATARGPNAGRARPAILAGGPWAQTLTDAAIAEFRRLGQTDITVVTPAGDADFLDIARQLSAAGIDRLLVLDGRTALEPLGRAAAPLDWRPDILVAGSAAGKALLAPDPALTDRLTVAHAILPTDWTGPAGQSFHELLSRHDLQRLPALPAALAYAWTQILDQAFRQAGHALTRADFVRTLEGMETIRTGLMPSASFGPGKHIGILGVHVMTAGMGESWISLN